MPLGVGAAARNRIERVLAPFDCLFRRFEAVADQTPTPQRLSQADIALAALVGLLSALAASWCASRIGVLYLGEGHSDYWFDADAPRALQNYVSLRSNHYRTAVHPISSLLLSPPAWVLRSLLGLPASLAAQIVVIAAAAGIGTLQALTFRLLGLGRLPTACLSMLLIASAAFMHWGSAVELYAPGAFTIALAIAALAAGTRLGPVAWIAVSALTLAVTVTNWMAGLAAALVRWRRLPFTGIIAASLVLVMALSLIQKGIFSDARLFFNPRGLLAEYKWTQPGMVYRDGSDARWSLADNLRTIAVSTIVAPPPYIDVRSDGTIARVSNQQLRWTSMTSAGTAAVVGWLVLLALGVWGAVRPGPHRAVAAAVGMMLVGQMVLHGIYGYPTFLYVAHSLPMLVTLTALAWFSPARRLVSLLALVVALLAGLSNSQQFLAATELLDQSIRAKHLERFTLLQQIAQRPSDPWPRWSGHVPLAVPGAPDTEKGWFEPGGSFSPTYGSFGISFWAANGTVLTTSDSVPLEQTAARYLDPLGVYPGIEVFAPLWRAEWRTVGGLGYDLTLESRASEGGPRIDIVVRSVGPAGGRLSRVAVEGDALRLPSGWTLEPVGKPLIAHLGVEGDNAWRRAEPEAARDQSVEDAEGWAFARIAAAAPGETMRFRLRRAMPLTDPKLPTAPGPLLKGLDPAFVQSLEAQIATLRIGLSNRETRPGDPINYPLQWQRDGAYVVVALARSGQIELARELALATVHDDFFGGFGAEADAPGLALWMLGEIASLSPSAEFDAAIWPGIVRRVRTIGELLDAKGEIRRPFTGPLVPGVAHHPDADLVAGASIDGLINGKMDWQRPVFYVNAASHAGLLGAAQTAERLGYHAEAAAWRERASTLAAAWNKAFANPAWAGQVANERTAIAGLWVGEIAEPVAYARYLEQRWPRLLASFGETDKAAPLWTYFALAEAHQHLRIGRADRTRAIIEKFAQRQPAPGLHTFWEGDGEENSFGLWQRTRGWAKPPNVTPHYWSAAEMLLLQLSMLAYREGDAVIIGAGLERSQLASPLSVTGIGIAGGFVDWSWSDGRLRVSVRSTARDLAVKPGPAFPSGVSIEVFREAAR